MKIFSTSAHAVLDYLTALFLITSPWIFNFENAPAAIWTMILFGLLSLTLSLFTDYEGGIFRSIPMRVHLTADTFFGAFLASSPWILGFAKDTFLPQLTVGLLISFVGLLTRKRPSGRNSEQIVQQTEV